MNRHTTLFLAASLALAVHFSGPPVAAQSPAPVETGFINGQVTLSGTTMLYVVYVPWNYTPQKQWPVILSLHGSTLEGKDGFKPLVYGIATQFWLRPERFPCLVVFPQQRSAGPWSGRFEELALRALEEVVQRYHGDRNRLYLTGGSLGGAGTWNFATDHPDLFAAAMPICGCGDYPMKKIVQAVKSLPIWVFHGEKDAPQCARAVVAAIQAAGNPNIHYTEYPGIGHCPADLAYGDPQVIEWLFAQHR